jgi:4-amino-4-deoxy-L-arabinose transferase-like glycosyltransferase
MIGVALRVHHLDYIDLWNDELFSRYYPETGLRFMWFEGFRLESTPPGYYTAIAAWMSQFGTSAVTLRSLSVLASSLAVLLAYGLGCELVGTTCGLLAALLFACSPTAIFYAQEARAYALMLLPLGFSMLCIARFIRLPHSGTALLGYVLSTIVVLYCHVTMLLAVAGFNLAVLVAALGAQRAIELRHLRSWIGANVLVALAALPLLLIVESPVSANGLAWIPPLSAHAIAWAVEWTLAGPVTPTQTFGYEATLLLLLLIAASCWSVPIERRTCAVVVVIPLAFVMLVAAASLHRSILLPRVMSWTVLPVSVLVAERLLRASRLRGALVAVTALILGVGLFYQTSAFDAGTDPWRKFVQAIKSELASADMVALGPLSASTGMAYYAPAGTRLWHWNEHLPPTVENTVIPSLLHVTEISRADLAAAIKSGQRVIIVIHGPDLPFVSALLRLVPPPLTRIEQACGGGPCLIALTW